MGGGGVLGTVTGADKIRPQKETPASEKHSRHASYS